MLAPEEAFHFDLKGYLVLEGALDRDRVLALGQEVAALDNKNADELPWSIPVWTPVINEYRVLNILDPVPDALEFVDHGAFYGRLEALMDGPFRMTEAYTITRGPGIGLYLHHLPEPISTYRLADGQPCCTYVKAVVPLADCGPDDGPFCVIEGSHKPHAPYPYSKLDPDWDPPTKDLAIVDMMEGHEHGRPKVDWSTVPGFKELPARAGDVILFTESLIHGARKNAGGGRRRGLYLGYGPSSCANWHGVQYSPELLARATDRQRFLMEGPQVGFRYQSTPERFQLPDHPAYPYYPNSEDPELR
jgi:hypothetical protein